MISTYKHNQLMTTKYLFSLDMGPGRTGATWPTGKYDIFSFWKNLLGSVPYFMQYNLYTVSAARTAENCIFATLNGLC